MCACDRSFAPKFSSRWSRSVSVHCRSSAKADNCLALPSAIDDTMLAEFSNCHADLRLLTCHVCLLRLRLGADQLKIHNKFGANLSQMWCNLSTEVLGRMPDVALYEVTSRISTARSLRARRSRLRASPRDPYVNVDTIYYFQNWLGARQFSRGHRRFLTGDESMAGHPSEVSTTDFLRGIAVIFHPP